MNQFSGFLFFSFFLFNFSLAFSQEFQASSDSASREWNIMQDSLDHWGNQMLRNSDYSVRRKASDDIRNTLYYMLNDPENGTQPFRELQTISLLMPPDSSFRVFSWQLYVDENTYEYSGFIQTLGDTARVFELQQRRRTAGGMMLQYRELPLSQWQGGIYYNLMQIETDSVPYYLVFAFDGFGYFERRKHLDVIRFNKQGEPIFGAPVFHKYAGEDRTGSKETFYRITLTYSAEAAVTLNYSAVHDHIIYNHLTPVQGTHPGQGLMFVPDGTYEGYKLDGSNWYYARRVFHQTLDEPPVPNPVLDSRRNRDIFGNEQRRRNR